MHVFKRMTHRTKHFEVSDFVIFAIAVLVVNPEDAGLFMVSASLAFCEHASPAHIFSGGGEGCNPNGFRGFVHAGAAAIFSVLGRACSKLFSAVSTSAGDRTFQVLSFVVATTRAIFGPIGARCNVLEVGTADFTDGLDVHTGRQRFARPRAILECFETIARYPDGFFAISTVHHLASGGCHAALQG